MEQEIMDLSNNLSRDGLIYFPEFSQIVLSRYREESQQEFNKIMGDDLTYQTRRKRPTISQF